MWVPLVCPFQRATRASPCAMSSISMSSGDGSRRSSRRPDSIRCQARGGALGRSVITCSSSRLLILTDSRMVPLVCRLARRERCYDLGGRAYARDARQHLLDREAMQLRIQAARRVLGDHDGIVLEPGVTRGGFDAEIGGNAGEDDGAYPTPSELQVELGAEEGAPLSLGDREIGGNRGDRRRRFREVGGRGG